MESASEGNMDSEDNRELDKMPCLLFGQGGHLAPTNTVLYKTEVSGSDPAKSRYSLRKDLITKSYEFQAAYSIPTDTTLYQTKNSDAVVTKPQNPLRPDSGLKKNFDENKAKKTFNFGDTNKVPQAEDMFAISGVENDIPTSSNNSSEPSTDLGIKTEEKKKKKKRRRNKKNKSL